MFGNIKELQEQMEAAKKRLDDIFVESDAGNGKVKVVVSVSKKIKDLTIDPEFMAQGDHEALEDMIVTALNRALEIAEERSQEEMKGMAEGLFPGLGGMF